MLMSMTGFSTRTLTMTLQGSPITLTMTLKSVNGRFFELNCKLPYALSNLETECSKTLKQNLKRGTVYFSVNCTQPSALRGAPQPAVGTIKQYLAGLEQIQKECNLPGTVTINDLITLPYLFETVEEPLDETAKKTFLEGLNPLIQDLLAERQREGAALATDLLQRVKKLRELIAQIAPRAHVVMAERKAALLEQFKPLLTAVQEEIKEQHLATIYQQLDRLDIHEEMVRFTTHLDHFEATIRTSEEEKGKKLDFTLQELFREINTMASKCTDAEISTATIAMKVEVEKAREQVQNIV